MRSGGGGCQRGNGGGGGTRGGGDRVASRWHWPSNRLAVVPVVVVPHWRVTLSSRPLRLVVQVAGVVAARVRSWYCVLVGGGISTCDKTKNEVYGYVLPRHHVIAVSERGRALRPSVWGCGCVWLRL